MIWVFKIFIKEEIFKRYKIKIYEIFFEGIYEKLCF